MESFTQHLHFLETVALRRRLDVLRMLHHAGSGHIGGCLSVIEILVALYYGRLSHGPALFYDPDKPGGEEQDYVVLSKGHASAVWYAVLADLGFFSKDELVSYRQMNSLLQAYPSKKIPGVSLSSGGPGVGFASAVGLAMALQMDRQKNRVVCIVGDGELQDGQFWEAAMVASQYKLDNITVMLDWNGLQMDGIIRSVIDVDPLADKFEACGWKSIVATDGHSFEDILDGLERSFDTQRRPSVVLCRTVKGKGVPFVENKPSYHTGVLSDQEMAEAIPLLEDRLVEMESRLVALSAGFDREHERLDAMRREYLGLDKRDDHGVSGQRDKAAQRSAELPRKSSFFRS